MDKKKRIFLIVGLSAVAVAAAITIPLVIKNNSKAKYDGSISVTLRKLNEAKTDTSVVSQKTLNYVVGDTLVSLLQANYTITMNKGMLMTIDTLDTASDWSHFIAFYVNDVYSQVGVEQYVLNNKDTILFKEEVYTPGA